MKKEKYPLVKEVTLNNKSRKGTYYYIKTAPNTRGSYYKKKEGVRIKDYIKAKKEGIVSKKRGVRAVSDMEKFAKKNFRGKKIDSLLQKGYAENTIRNAETLTQFNIKKAYMNLLLDKDHKGTKGLKMGGKEAYKLAEILSRPENVPKWNQHIEYVAIIKGEQGEELGKFRSAHKNQTLEGMISFIKEYLKKGTEVSYEQYIGTLMKNKGLTYEHKKSGKVTGINIIMVYRK